MSDVFRRITIFKDGSVGVEDERGVTIEGDAAPTKVRRWSMLTQHCIGCDRPSVCAIIKEGTAPCGRNRLVTVDSA